MAQPKNGEGHDLIHRPLAPELLPSSSGRVASHSADHRLWCTREKHVRSSGERRGFRGVLAFAVCFSAQKRRASDCRRVRSVWGSKGRGQSPVSGRRLPPPSPSLPDDSQVRTKKVRFRHKTMCGAVRCGAVLPVCCWIYQGYSSVGECTVGPRRLGLEVQGFIKYERVHGGIKAF